MGGNIFLGSFLKIFLHFSPQKMFIYSPNISDAQVGGPKAAHFGPLDFLQVGGPFRKVGGRGLPWMYGNSSTGCYQGPDPQGPGQGPDPQGQGQGPNPKDQDKDHS